MESALHDFALLVQLKLHKVIRFDLMQEPAHPSHFHGP